MVVRAQVAALRPSTPTDADLDRYIAEMCTEMRRMAHRPRYDVLRYLLDMVRIEAERLCEATGSTPPR